MPAFGASLGVPFKSAASLARFPFDALQYINGLNDGTDTLYDQTANEYNVELRQSAALAFDGVGDYVGTGVTLPDASYPFILKAKFHFPTIAGSEEQGVVGQGITTGSFGISVTDEGEVRGGVRGTTPSYLTTTETFSAGDYIDATIEWDGISELYFEVNGASQTQSSAVTGSYDAGSIEVGSTSGVVAGSPAFFNGIIIDVDFCCSGDSSKDFHYLLSELSGTTVYDTSGNGNDGTITTLDLTTMRAARQDVSHQNMLKGFSLYQHVSDPDILVPYLDSGVPYPSPTVPAGYTKTYDSEPIGKDRAHNRAETGVQQIDGNEAVLGHSTLFYEADGTTEKIVYIADFDAFVSGNDNTWLGMETDDNGVCIAKGWAIYAEDFSPTLSEYNRIVNRLPNTCGAGQIEPIEDLGISVEDEGDVIYDG